MGKKVLLIFLLTSNIYSNNSIFNSANSPRVNALGGCTFSSNNISDVFNSNLNINKYIIDKTYFSHYTYFNNSIRVFQFVHNIFNNENHSLNFGGVSRLIKGNYNTLLAWNIVDDLQYENIDYSNINSFSDYELGLLVSYDKSFKGYILNAKIKPIMHFIDKRKSFGCGLDFLVSKNFNKLNIVLGFKDFLYKDWNSNYNENISFKTDVSLTYKFNNFFIILNYLETNSKIGFEYNLSEDFVIRAGSSQINDYSYGFGVKKDVITFDYAFYKINPFYDYINQFSLAFNF